MTYHMAAHFLNKKSQIDTCHNHKMTRDNLIFKKKNLKILKKFKKIFKKIFKKF